MFKKVKTRLFNRYLFSIFCVVAIAVILVTLLIFTIYANLQVSSARTYSVHQLEQVCQMTDMLYSQMHSVNNQILQNSNTNRCLSSNTFNRLIEADAGIKLREIQTAQSYTRYVSLYNSASNRFVSSSTADFLTDDDIAYYYRRLPDNPGADTCLLRMIGANYATQQLKTRYVYSFVFRVQLRKGGSPDLIIVDVDEDYFNDSISNLRTSNGFQQVLLLNRYGEVFSTNIAEGDSETFTHAKPDNTIPTIPAPSPTPVLTIPKRSSPTPRRLPPALRSSILCRTRIFTAVSPSSPSSRYSPAFLCSASACSSRSAPVQSSLRQSKCSTTTMSKSRRTTMPAMSSTSSARPFPICT